MLTTVIFPKIQFRVSRVLISDMDDPPQPISEDPEGVSQSQDDRHRNHLRQLGIDPDDDPIDILIQITDLYNKLNRKT